MKKINLCFLDVMKNGQMFPSKVYHSEYDHGEIGNINRCKEIHLQKIIKFRLSE